MWLLKPDFMVLFQEMGVKLLKILEICMQIFMIFYLIFLILIECILEQMEEYTDLGTEE